MEQCGWPVTVRFVQGKDKTKSLSIIEERTATRGEAFALAKARFKKCRIERHGRLYIVLDLA